ncbi:hypothetical protein QUF76_00595 [Desulfobacterales bacterium HSG16]|nr:hypothetical protein [Desulfobacterales bacterium HSG16]
MSISQKLGTLIVFAVPAIVGGGIVYATLGHNYMSVAVFEILLATLAGGMISR